MHTPSLPVAAYTEVVQAASWYTVTRSELRAGADGDRDGVGVVEGVRVADAAGVRDGVRVGVGVPVRVGVGVTPAAGRVGDGEGVGATACVAGPLSWKPTRTFTPSTVIGVQRDDDKRVMDVGVPVEHVVSVVKMFKDKEGLPADR